MIKDKDINILNHSDWVTICVGIFSFVGTAGLGFVAIYQNNKMSSVNDRLLNIEENKNKTYLIFNSGNVLAYPPEHEVWQKEEFIFDYKNDIMINTTNDIKNCTVINPKISFVGDKKIKRIKIDFILVYQQNLKSKEKNDLLLLQPDKDNPISFIDMGKEYKSYVTLPITNIENYIDKENMLEVILYITATNIFDIKTEYALRFTISNMSQNIYGFNCYHLISTMNTDI